ncbi:MAG: DUF6062 family protein [Chloroflexota bacterium]
MATSDSDTPTSPHRGAPLDPTAFNILTALKQTDSACPICRLVQKGVVSYLDAISYESVNDPDTRHQIRKAFGYCAAHGQEWLRLQDTLGTALIYRDVLNHALDIMQTHIAPPSDTHPTPTTPTEGSLRNKVQRLFGGNTGDTAPARALAADLAPTAPCPACLYTLTLEADMLQAFVNALSHNSFMAAYRLNQTGLCLPHLRQALPRITNPHHLRVLIQAQEMKLASTLANLSEVIRKFDYRNTAEQRGNEFQVPARSVEQASGSLPTQLNLPATNPRP